MVVWVFIFISKFFSYFLETTSWQTQNLNPQKLKVPKNFVKPPQLYPPFQILILKTLYLLSHCKYPCFFEICMTHFQTKLCITIVTELLQCTQLLIQFIHTYVMSASHYTFSICFLFIHFSFYHQSTFHFLATGHFTSSTFPFTVSGFPFLLRWDFISQFHWFPFVGFLVSPHVVSILCEDVHIICQ